MSLRKNLVTGGLVLLVGLGGITKIKADDDVTNPAQRIRQVDSNKTKVIFQSNRDGNNEIYTINSDGNQTNLTNTSVNEFDPVPSPDGSQIAFSSYAGRNTLLRRIFVMDSDGSKRKQLTGGDYSDVKPIWFPDGKRLLFGRIKGLPEETVRGKDQSGRRKLFTPIGNFTEIYSVTLDGVERNLTKSVSTNLFHSISPRGDRIAFASDRDGLFDIYTMNSDGKNQTRLTTGYERCLGSQWSPDGNRILFHRTRVGKMEVMSVNVDGSELDSIGRTKAYFNSYCWSPDGKQVAYSTHVNGTPNRDIFVVNLDNGVKVNITNSLQGDDTEPKWSPDGKNLLYLTSPREGDHYSDIFVYDFKRKESLNLTNSKSKNTNPNWSR